MQPGISSGKKKKFTAANDQGRLYLCDSLRRSTVLVKILFARKECTKWHKIVKNRKTVLHASPVTSPGKTALAFKVLVQEKMSVKITVTLTRRKLHLRTRRKSVFCLLFSFFLFGSEKLVHMLAQYWSYKEKKSGTYMLILHFSW